MLQNFLQKESAGGILLIGAAVLAMVLANSPLSFLYDVFLAMPIEVRIGQLEIAKPLLLWINDGLMVIFFLAIGIELKREMVEGELSNRKNIILPAMGAVGGMLIPGLIYTYFNKDDPVAISGWAIPTATDIAFSLGVLSLLGSRVPIGLKIFLTSLAIFDDVGAIIIIAIFYTANISMVSLVIALVCIIGLFLLKVNKVTNLTFYFFIGTIMWVALLKSGVHATLSGIVLAMFIPIGSSKKPQNSPLHKLEHELMPLVAFVVLPFFAFANAGIDFSTINTEQLMHNVTIGTTLGLFLGKQIGIMLAVFLAVKMKLASLPQGSNWVTMYGIAVICGIGFTMSLFIGSLAFESAPDKLFDERLGIIAGSLISSIFGYFILHKNLPPKSDIPNIDESGNKHV
jgi:Na+:H+ antiporter, NhaA family